MTDACKMTIKYLLFGIFNLYEILYLKSFYDLLQFPLCSSYNIYNFNSSYKLKIMADLDPNVGIFLRFLA